MKKFFTVFIIVFILTLLIPFLSLISPEKTKNKNEKSENEIVTIFSGESAGLEII